MHIRTIFINGFDRLRSGWRFGSFLALFVIAGVGLQATFIALVSMVPREPRDPALLNMAVGSFAFLSAAILAGWVCGKYLEGLPLRALGVWFTGNWLKDLSLGVAAGALAVSLAILIAAAYGGLRFQLNPEAGQTAIFRTLGLSFIVFLIAAAFEEVLFRGYVLQTFTRAGLAWLAIILTSAFFGMIHLDNPNSNWISTVNTILAGILFSAAYLKTRTLWFVFGLHFFWNWMQGAFFGIEVSGLTDITAAPLLREIDRGPAWLTGETYGIEGGIACTISLVIFTLLIWYLPVLKPTGEMSALTSRENPGIRRESAAQDSGSQV